MCVNTPIIKDHIKLIKQYIFQYFHHFNWNAFQKHINFRQISIKLHKKFTDDTLWHNHKRFQHQFIKNTLQIVTLK